MSLFGCRSPLYIASFHKEHFVYLYIYSLTEEVFFVFENSYEHIFSFPPHVCYGKKQPKTSAFWISLPYTNKCEA